MVFEKLKLTGKTILITGAGTGLGREMALALSSAGANLVIAARREKLINEVCEMIKQRGNRAIAIPADLTDSKQVENLVQSGLDQFKSIDVLINNAGIVRGHGSTPIWEISDDDWHLGIDTNLSTAFFCSRAVASHMVDNGRGKIINVASGFGLRGGRDNYMYACGKGGVVQLTRTLATSLGRYGITSNCIVPGYFPTEGTNASRETLPKSDFIPVGRVGSPSELGPIAVFLASDSSNYMNGEMFVVDGGGIAGGITPTRYIPKYN